MCYGAEAAWVPAVIAAVGAGVSAYNTDKTAKRQDSAAAQSIINQGHLQQKADQQVDQQIDQLQGSSMQDERENRLNEFMTTLAQNRRQSRGDDSTELFAGDAFKAANEGAIARADTATNRAAQQLATIDAAGLQRQGEATGYGHLATDIGLVGRQSSGQAWLDALRARQIRRSTGLDLTAGALQGVASSMGSGAGTGASTAGVTREQIPLVYSNYGGGF